MLRTVYLERKCQSVFAWCNTSISQTENETRWVLCGQTTASVFQREVYKKSESTALLNEEKALIDSDLHFVINVAVN